MANENEDPYENFLRGLPLLIQPSAYFRAVTIPIAQKSYAAWVRARILHALEAAGYIVVPEYEADVDIVAFSPLDEKPVLAVQVTSVLISAKTRAMIRAVGSACPKLYIAASKKRKRVYSQVSRLSPETLCYAPYFGFVQVPVSMISVFRNL